MKDLLKAGIYLLAFVFLGVAMFVVAIVGLKSLFSGDFIKFIGAIAIIYFVYDKMSKFSSKLDCTTNN